MRRGAPDREELPEPRGKLRRASWLVALAASAGGIPALRTILSALPREFPGAVVVLQHRPPEHDGTLAEILGRACAMPVRVAMQGEMVRPGHVYIGRPDSHLTVTADKAFIYRDGTRIRHVRSSANPLFETAAQVFEGHVIAVVLTGGGMDATDGVQTVKAYGGIVIAQDEPSSEAWGMPRSAISTGAVDYILPIEAIGPALDGIVHGRPVSTGA
jgi:two-component system chemotaxis response regulator CheB